MRQHGKLTIKGQRTYNDEVYVLNQGIKKLVDQNRQREKKSKYVCVPILKGYLMVETDKYKRNKKHYDDIAVSFCGKVETKKVGK